MRQNFSVLRLKISRHGLFLFSYFLYILTETFDSSYIGEMLSANIRRGVKGVIILLLLFQLFLKNRYEKKVFFKYLLLCSLAVLVAFFSKEPNVLVIILLLLTCLDVKIDSIVNISTYTMLASFLIIVFLSLIGVLPDLVYSHYSIMTRSSVQAHSFGFRYYSTPSFLILFMSFCFIYKHKNLRTLIICLIVNSISYYIFTAKLPFFSYIMFLSLIFILKLNNYKTIRTVNTRILPILPFILAIVIYVLSKYYHDFGKLGIMINSFLSGRLEQGSIGLRINELSFFGRYFDMVGRYSSTYSDVLISGDKFYIDSDYLYMTLHFGIIYSVFIIFCYSVAIKKYVIMNDIYMMSWAISIIIFAVVNWCLHNVEYNPFLFIGFMALMEKNKKSEKIRLQLTREGKYEF